MSKESTAKEVKVDRQKRQVNTKLVDGWNYLLKWLDTNVMPMIALPVLGVFAADSIRSHVTRLPENGALLFAVAIVAFLMVKTHK